jgi:BirA family biotin operon repressor/biotin-[acetyl-CoA-carboxylase] ligase
MNAPLDWTRLDFDVVESTNDLAKQLAAEGNLRLPLAVRASRQTKGRGRGAHQWWSDSGSVTVSLVVEPARHRITPDREPRIALATAVAVIDALADSFRSVPLGIRWPNDIETAGRKVGGILPERVETPAGPRLVVGIGLNVSTRLDTAPRDVRDMAASLAELARVPVTPAFHDALYSSILERFGAVLSELGNDDRQLAARWMALDLLRGRRVSADLGGQIVTGTGAGIGSDGALILDLGHETLRLFGGQILRSAPESAE